MTTIHMTIRMMMTMDIHTTPLIHTVMVDGRIAMSRPERTGFWGLLSLGISGGIVPCVDALIGLLFAISLNKLVWGLIILCAFSLGLAAVSGRYRYSDGDGETVDSAFYGRRYLAPTSTDYECCRRYSARGSISIQGN